MKRPLALSLLTVLIGLTAVLSYKIPLKPLTLDIFANTSSSDSISSNVMQSATEKVFVLTELGCPSEGNFTEKQLTSRIPWDLTVFDEKLFIGCGDYAQNTGPCNVWQYDLNTAEWSISGKVDDEAVINFEIINGKLIITGTDPKATWENGSFYMYTNGGWQTDRSVPFGVHMFDIAEHNGQTFYAIGNQNNTQSPVQVTSDGKTFANAPFYIDGIELINNPGYGFSRCYNLFESQNRLFAFCWWSDSSNQAKMTGIFEFVDNAFYFVTKLSDLGAESLGTNRQILLNKAITYNNKFYLSTGYLYATDDFKSLKKIEIPNNSYVEDLAVSNGKLLVLTSFDNGDNTFTNTIWQYSEQNDLEKVYEFEYSQAGISLENYGDMYFVGIGKTIDTTTETDNNSPARSNGNILMIAPQQ